MQFNSPKNFKKGRLIANRYRPIDLLIAGIAIAMTLSSEMIYLLLMNGKHTKISGSRHFMKEIITDGRK